MSAARRNRTLAGPNRSNISNTHLFRGTKITKPGKIPRTLEKGVQTSQVDVLLGKLQVPVLNAVDKPTAIAHEKYKLEEQATLTITNAHIKRYWKARESERLMHTIHQGDLDDQTKILRLFDITSQYGPCIGISRSKRWARANRLRLSPPIEVLAILSKHQDSQIAGNNERAYVDELLS
ncbi:DNA polymerase delta subunit 4 [Golovinomyces cichoracearum]|uniref:DNA polymerase delta subunit 4 n=1 Tax=Golovinomyces cichoracearum TaxID=62708 RepID=A0A420JBX9_9PEZI|nr:DNA polymerase delta subunit 4 [Golovinomyces cichoracearum]